VSLIRTCVPVGTISQHLERGAFRLKYACLDHYRRTGKQEVVAVQSRLLVRDSSVTASAFIVTYVVKLPTSRLLGNLGDLR